MLAAIAHRLRQLIGESSFFARIAGDEFICLMKDYSSDQAIELGKHLQSEIQSLNPEIRPGQHASANLSFGVAAYPAEGQSINELLHIAAVATRQDKSNRKHFVSETFRPAYSQPANPTSSPSNASSVS